MVDIKYLRSRGISSGDYRKIFSADPEAYPSGIKRLVRLLRDRSNEGYWLNMRNWRMFAAIDLACDEAFRQTTPTMVRHILSRNLNAQATVDCIKEWGLSEQDLLVDKDVTVNGVTTTQRVVNTPVFYKVLLPLVMAYLIGREARLFNERVGTFLEFKPRKKLTEDRVACEVWTDLAKTQAQQLGYHHVLQQAIHQMLKYGVCLAFPQEQWYCEKQIIDGQQEVIREGIRYVLPHPTRMFYDLSYPLPSLNTNSGCEYAAHWSVRRYGDILDNRDYWNRRKIFCGTNFFNAPMVGDYFSNFFPCTLQFPDRLCSVTTVTREDKAAFYHVLGDRDRAVFLTEHYFRLVPRRWGLGSYNYPVWHRFTLAGPDTVIWAEPFAYNPVWFMGYDHDANASRNTSLALELIPWQDHLGNLLTNMLLTCYRNLANLILYNSQVIDESTITALNSSGYRLVAGLNTIPYDPLGMRAGFNEPDKVVHKVDFPYVPINDQLQMVNTLLNLLDRVLGFSAQEQGAAASHQQSVEEVRLTSGATSSRAKFTGTFIDSANDAWKHQIRDGSLAYLDPDITAEVSSDIPNLKEVLSNLGFEVTSQGPEKWGIKGHKKALRLEGFASATEQREAQNDQETARAIWQAISVIASNQPLAASVGTANILKMIESATVLAGGPPEFRIEPTKGTDQVAPNVISAIQAAQKATIEAIQQKLVQPAAEHIGQTEQQLQALQQTVQQLGQVVGTLQKAANAADIKAQEAQAEISLEAAKAQAEERRSQQAHAADMQRKAEQAQLDASLKAAKTAADIEAKRQATAAKVAATEAAAEAKANAKE